MFMVQPWVPPLAHLLPTSSSKSLRSRPYVLPLPPQLWLRYVDGIFVIQWADHCHHFLQQINSQDPHIQFTIEDSKEDGCIPFLDTLVSCGPNNTLTTTVYHKHTHMDQYLHWDSNYFLADKHSMCKTLSHRASIVCTSQPAF